MTEMTLREVCQSTGVSRRAIQGYEKARLVSASGKTASGYLLYDHAARERITQIKLYQDMGFSVKEIKSIIDAAPKIRKTALMKRKDQLYKDFLHKQRMLEIIQEMIDTL